MAFLRDKKWREANDSHEYNPHGFTMRGDNGEAYDDISQQDASIDAEEPLPSHNAGYDDDHKHGTDNIAESGGKDKTMEQEERKESSNIERAPGENSRMLEDDEQSDSEFFADDVELNMGIYGSGDEAEYDVDDEEEEEGEDVEELDANLESPPEIKDDLLVPEIEAADPPEEVEQIWADYERKREEEGNQKDAIQEEKGPQDGGSQHQPPTSITSETGESRRLSMANHRRKRKLIDHNFRGPPLWQMPPSLRPPRILLRNLI